MDKVTQHHKVIISLLIKSGKKNFSLLNNLKLEEKTTF